MHVDGFVCCWWVLQWWKYLFCIIFSFLVLFMILVTFYLELFCPIACQDIMVHGHCGEVLYILVVITLYFVHTWTIVHTWSFEVLKFWSFVHTWSFVHLSFMSSSTLSWEVFKFCTYLKFWISFLHVLLNTIMVSLSLSLSLSLLLNTDGFEEALDR